MKYKGALIVSSLSFALLSVFRKMVGESISTSLLVFSRVFLAALIVFAVFYFQRKSGELKLKKKDVIEFALFGVVFGASLYFYFKALLFAPLSNVILLGFTAPLLSAVASHFALKEEITNKTILALFASLVGVALVVSEELKFDGYALGYLFAFAWIILMVVSSVFTKYEEKKRPLSQVVFWPFIFASIFFLVTSLFEGTTFTGGFFELCLVVGIGVLTACGFLFYDFAMEYLDEHVVFVLSQIMTTIFAAAMAAVLLGEPLTSKVIVGGTILVASGLLIVEEPRTRVRHHFK